MTTTATTPHVNLSQLRTRMLIGGEWRDAADGSTFAVYDPATGGQIARVPQAGAVDVDAAVRAARAALQSESWRDMLPATRERLLLKLADLVEQNGDELAKLETLNQGKLLGRRQALLTRIISIGIARSNT
jgi:phenylacetaldehyde dehydrogenase